MGDLRATMEAGFQGHVDKPVDGEVLLATIERILGAQPRARPRRRRWR